MVRHQATELDLVFAIAKAENTDVVLKVVDQSLEKAAELRREREKRDAEERLKEERDRRIEEFERREEQAAAKLAERNERKAEEIARRESEAEALRIAYERSVSAKGHLDFVL